jgi:proprotein convertase subtilisin/kexin type 5
VPTQSCENNNNCWANLTYTLNGGAEFCNYCDVTCLTCNGSLSTNCTSCNNFTYRSQSGFTCPCLAGYIDIGTANCYPCSNFIPGCATCLSSTLCTSCSSGFTLNMLGVCQCTTGFLVTGVCTSLVGCVSASNLQGTVYCLACNSTLNYVRSTNFTCICNTGFVMNAVEDCNSLCGDSVIVSGEGCDDGNTVGGDGCSSTCQVETSYYCDNSSPPSTCYIIANISATVKYVQRVLTANEAIFALDLKPFYSDY